MIRGRGARSLTLRLYLIGLLQLAALLLPAILLYGPPSDAKQAALPAVVARYLSAVRAHADAPRAMDDALAELRSSVGVDVSVYGEDGALMATSVEPPLEARAPRASRMHEASATTLDLGGKKALVVTRSAQAARSLVSPPVMNFICGFVVVAVGALLTSRWIVRPLRDLSRAARAFGSGDIRSRAVATRADEIGEVGVTFNEMADRVEAMILAEKELLANVSHELRTPLARIRVAIQLADEGDPDAVRAYLAEITTDLVELEEMIDDIFAATRVAMREGSYARASFAMKLERLSPRTIGERARDRFAARHARRELRVTIDPSVPDVDGDPVLLRRVFDNLLENSHKYSPDSASAIELRVRAEDAAVTFEVEDHGDGIDAADLPKIFQPFFRADRSRSRRTGGVGLGLTLVKRIVDAHGGTIEVTSEVTRGTTARVRIPTAKG